MLTPVLLLCTLASGIASAYEPDRARANMAREAAQCAAYFMSIASAPVLRTETKDRLDGYGKDLFDFSSKLTNRKITQTRVELAQQTMKHEMGNNWGHLSILNNKYGGLCHGYLDAPEARLQYWLDKRD